MTINTSTVRRWAYATRSDLLKVDPPVVAATIERFFAEPSVAPAPIPSHIKIRQVIFEAVKQGPCQMPLTIRPRHLHVGRYRGCL